MADLNDAYTKIARMDAWSIFTMCGVTITRWFHTSYVTSMNNTHIFYPTVNSCSIMQFFSRTSFPLSNPISWCFSSVVWEQRAHVGFSSCGEGKDALVGPGACPSGQGEQEAGIPTGHITSPSQGCFCSLNQYLDYFYLLIVKAGTHQPDYPKQRDLLLGFLISHTLRGKKVAVECKASTSADYQLWTVNCVRENTSASKGHHKIQK